MNDREKTSDPFLQAVRTRLGDEERALDDDTRRALRLARDRALDGGERRGFGRRAPSPRTTTP